jgi:hypothetical protein
MSPAATPRRAQTPRRRQRETERRRRRVAVVLVLSIIAAVVIVVSAFGGSGTSPQTAPAASASSKLLIPAGPPSPEIVARIGSLHLQLPVSQSRVTAVGYQGGSDGSIALTPVGRQANQGLIRRVLHAVVGSSSGGPRWYQLPGGGSSPTSLLDVGGAAGTDVYSPVDGTVVGISNLVLNGRPHGSTIEIQPSGAPSIVVTISHIRVDPGLAVGSAVTAGGSKIGEVVDFSSVERQVLSRYTNDTGNHVAIEVHPSATLEIQ